MNYADVFHIDRGGPRTCKLLVHLDAAVHAPSGIETWVRQSQELLVTRSHEVYERLFPRSNASATSTSVFSERDVGIQAVDQDESWVQGNHFGQLVLPESLRPGQADMNLFHLLRG